MTHEASAGTDGRDRDERARGDLLDFLNDVRPTMFVSESLAYLLRTAHPRNVDPEEVVELIAAWADERAESTHEAVSVLYLGALRRVLDADREVSLAGFDAEAFLADVGQGLTRHCPSSELGGLQSALRDLRGPATRVPVAAPAATRGAETVEIRGMRMSVRHAQETAVARLEHQAYMTDADFDAAFADLEAALATRVGAPIHTLLSRVAGAAGRIFNTGRVRQAGRLCRFLVASFERLAISAEGQLEVRFAIGPSELNEGLLAKTLASAEQREWAAWIVRLVGYLGPAEALDALATENRRERRRLLLAAVEAYGSDGYNLVLDHLSALHAGGQRWYATRNYLYLLSRIDPPDAVLRHRAIDEIGRYVTHDQPQLRAAAIAALRHIGGREAIPFAVRALDPAAYAPGSIDDSDALKRHLFVAMETVVETGNEAAIAIVAEYATGARGAEFDLGPALRDEACAALMHHKAPLPRRAALVVAHHLEQLCGRRFKLVTGRLALGLDTHACRMLSALIRSSTEPECRDALDNPVLVKVVARTTGDLA